MTDAPTPRIAILGGGISGLAAALKLQERLPRLQWDLFESQSALGGVLGTEHVDGFLLERSADMFSTLEPWALGLCRRIGFDDELINTNEQHRRAFVVCNRRLHAVPEGFTLLQPRKLLPVMRSRLLSWRGKMRLLAEYFVAARQSMDDESLADFTVRRFGREVFERLVQPLVGGIYTADPFQLSMAATLERFSRMEREHGGLIRAVLSRAAKKQAGMTAEGAGARYGMFVAPRQGMSALVEAIVAQLRRGSLHTEHAIRELTRTAEGEWRLTIAPRGGAEYQATYQAVIIALPAHSAADVLAKTDVQIAQMLRQIPVAGAAVVAIGLRRDQIRHPLDGFGYVVPLIEKRRVLAVSFSSIKFAGRAPDDHVLLRIFIGGACQPELLELDDDELVKLARAELTELLGMQGEPRLQRVIRWAKTMPQYHVGHLERVSAIEQRVEWPNLALAGNAYRGVGIPFCVRSGEEAVERLAGWFESAAVSAP